MVENVLRFSIKACNFKNFSEVMPSTSLAIACSGMLAMLSTAFWFA